MDPSLQGKPVIVGGRSDSRGVVASASYQARAFGVHAAMPLTQARRVCPNAVFLTGNYHKYREFSEKFMAILASYSPVLEPGGLDEAYLDMTGCENFGSWHKLALKIKERIRKETGLVASIGVASCKVVAKIASDLSKPDGLIEVLQGQEKGFLAPLPVKKLPGVGKKTDAVLTSIGIKTIGQLADMPEKVFQSRFGSGMAWLHRYAKGIDDSPVEPWGEAKSISRETTFENDTLDAGFLKATLYYFAEKLGTELREMDKKAKTVELKLRYADFETVSRSHTSREATNLNDTIFQTGVRLLESMLSTKVKPVRLLGLGVSHLVQGESQLSLFDAEARHLERLDRTIDGIREKYGFNAIQSGYALNLKQKHAGKTRNT